MSSSRQDFDKEEDDDWETIMKPSSLLSSSSRAHGTELTYVSIHPTALSMPFSSSESHQKRKGISIQMTPSQSHAQQPYRGKSSHHDCLQMTTTATTTTSKRTTTSLTTTETAIKVPPPSLAFHHHCQQDNEDDDDKEEHDQETPTVAASGGMREELHELPRLHPMDLDHQTPHRRKHHQQQRLEEQSSSPPRRGNDDSNNNNDDGDMEDDDDDHIVLTSEIYSTTTTSRCGTLFRTIMVSAGNVLVWYDFAIFGFFSDILGKVFFPQQDEHSGGENDDKSLMESFGVFGLAFLMRPIGGLMFGYIGDTRGRKRALEISIFLMAFATFSLGVLPDYEMVGDWAVPMLIAARMLQGLSVGGHLMSSLVYTCERCPQSQWGWYGSFVVAAANFGTLLAGLSGFAIQSLLPEDEILQGAWRIPFLLGAIVIFPGLYLCLMCHDDDLHQEHQSSKGGKVLVLEKKKNPLVEAFRPSNLRSLLSAAMVPMLWSAGFYLSFVWMATYMKDLVYPPVRGAFAVNSSSLFLSVCICFPIAGRLSDTFGRKWIMTIGGASMGILGPLAVMVIAQDTNPLLAFLSQSMIGISLSCWGGPMCAWLVESFEPAARLTSVATGYNLAQAIVGGFTPLLATAMVNHLGVDSPGFILSGLASVSLIGLWIVAPQSRHGSAFQNVPGDEPSIMTAKGFALDESFSNEMDDDKYDEEYLEERVIT